MKTLQRIILTVMLLLNVLVLMGQLWPDGAPPFAQGVNIVFLSLNLVFLSFTIVRKKH